MFRLGWLQVGGATRAMPRRDRTHRKLGPLSGWSLAWPCFKVAVNQAPSVIAATAAAVACSARAASSAASRAGSSTGATAARLLRTRRCFRWCRGICGALDRRHPGHDRRSFVPVRGGNEHVAVRRRSVARRDAVEPRPSRSEPSSRGSCRHPGNGASSSLPGNKTSYQTRRQDPSSRLARRPVRPAQDDGLDA